VGTDIDHIYGENNWNLQPRVGAIWDPSRSGRTIVRLAYGVYVNQPTTNVVAGAIANPPLVTPLSYSGPVGFDNASRLRAPPGLLPPRSTRTSPTRPRSRGTRTSSRS
jgi:hypothetical protein